MSISGIGTTGYVTGITNRRSGTAAAGQTGQSSGSFAQTIQQALTRWRIPESNSVSSLTGSLFGNTVSGLTSSLFGSSNGSLTNSLFVNSLSNFPGNTLTGTVNSWYRPSYVAVPVVITEEAYEKMQEDPQASINTLQSWWNSYAERSAFSGLGINPSVVSAYQQILNGFGSSA